MNNAKTSPDRGKHLAVAAAALLMVALLGAFIYGRAVRLPWQAGLSRPLPSRQSYLQETERKGVLSAADYARLAQVSDGIQHRHQMTDDDLDAWTAVLQRGPLKDTPANRMSFDTIVLGLGIGRKRLTPPQQAKMYEALLPFVSDSAYANTMDPSDTRTDPSDPATQQNLRTGSEETAVMLLAETRDPRALGVLKGLSQSSPSPRLRRAALKEHDILAAALEMSGRSTEKHNQ